MQTLFVVLQMTVALLLDALSLLMLARAIISWLPDLSDSSLGDFLFTVTEWVIHPVRVLFDRFGWGQNMMLDMPFFVTFIILSIVRTML